MNASRDIACGPRGARSTKRTEATWPARACTLASRAAPEGSRAAIPYQWSAWALTAIGAVSRPISAWPSRTSTLAPAGEVTSISECPSDCGR